MVKALIFAVLLPAAPAVYAADGGRDFAGYLSFWTQDCRSASCSLPKPVSLNRPVSFPLGLPSAPGEASAATAREVLWPDADSPLYADLAVYAVCPYVPARRAGGACAGLYYQVQLTLSGAAESFCSAALNEGDALPWPVMTCGGRSVPGTRLGVTLHRRPY